MKNLSVREVNFWYWLVQRLPYKLVYFSFMWVVVKATTGKYGNANVAEITCMDAIKRYERDLM